MTDDGVGGYKNDVHKLISFQGKTGTPWGTLRSQLHIHMCMCSAWIACLCDVRQVALFDFLKVFIKEGVVIGEHHVVKFVKTRIAAIVVH